MAANHGSVGGHGRDPPLSQHDGTRILHARRPYGGGGRLRQRGLADVIDLSGYKLIIFDKDGTLIDFDAMWGGWVEALAARLETITGARLAQALFQSMGYDPAA